MYSLGIILSAFFGVLLYFIAGRRGLNKVFWMIMGFVFGIFAVPFVFIVKPRPVAKQSVPVRALSEESMERDMETDAAIPDETEEGTKEQEMSEK